MMRLRRSGLLIASFLLVAGSVASAAVYRIQTDAGELIITTESPDVEVVVRHNGKDVRIIDTKTGKEIKVQDGVLEMELDGKTGLKLSVDKARLRRGETVLATVTSAAAAAVAEPAPAAKAEVIRAIEWRDEEQGFPAHIFQTGISPDGKLFFGAGDGGPTGGIRLYEVATGKDVQDLRPGGDVWYSSAAFVLGGKFLAASYKEEQDLFLWDIEAAKVVRKMTGHTDLGVGIAASPDGKRLLSWSNDQTLRVWDPETGKQLHNLQGHDARAEGLFSPDGKRILTYSPEKTLRVWDVATGNMLRKLEGHDDACNGSFSPDGKLIVSFSLDHTARLWDAETGKELRRLEQGDVKDGARGFIAGGKQIAAFCDDARYRIWDTATGRTLREIDLADVGGDRWSMTASPDGRLALVNHQDGSVRVYELATGKEIHRYDDCRKARAFSFSPDGRYAVAGSFRAGLFVFRLP